jgi:hypothetical protein
MMEIHVGDRVKLLSHLGPVFAGQVGEVVEVRGLVYRWPILVAPDGKSYKVHVCEDDIVKVGSDESRRGSRG